MVYQLAYLTGALKLDLAGAYDEAYQICERKAEEARQ
jgi:hypothetical protein